LLHCVCGESSSPAKRSGVVKPKSYKKKRLGQKLLQVQYHRAFSAAMRDSDSLTTVQQDRMSRLDDHRRKRGNDDPAPLLTGVVRSCPSTKFPNTLVLRPAA